MENTKAGRLGHTEESRAEGQISGGSPLSFTGRIARWSALHRWWVVGASAIFIVMAFMVLGNVETKTLDYNGEGDSAKAADLITDRFDVVATPPSSSSSATRH